MGPLLFLLMIGDIDILLSFADDTRLLKIIQSLTDTFKLQSDSKESTNEPKVIIWS